MIPCKVLTGFQSYYNSRKAHFKYKIVKIKGGYVGISLSEVKAELCFECQIYICQIFLKILCIEVFFRCKKGYNIVLNSAGFLPIFTKMFEILKFCTSNINVPLQ